MTTDRELDDLAESYYLDPPADVWLEERVQAWILPWLAKQCSGRTLEMGYGTGIVGERLYSLGVDLTVVEGSARLVAEATRVPPGRIVQALFEEYDPGPVFDTCLALHVCEHVENPVALLRRVKTWLRPGGRLIVEVPNAWSVHRQVGALMTGEMIDTLSERDKLVGHVRVYGFDELESNVREAGFTVEERWGFMLKPVNNARMLDWPPELIDALCDIGWHGEPEDAANIGLIATA